MQARARNQPEAMKSRMIGKKNHSNGPSKVNMAGQRNTAAAAAVQEKLGSAIYARSARTTITNECTSFSFIRGMISQFWEGSKHNTVIFVANFSQLAI